VASKEKQAQPKIESPEHVDNWMEGLENHKRLMQILPFMKEQDEGYL
jgi:hypothetical protein